MRFVVGLLAVLSTSARAADRPATHGMVLFGDGVVYVSHLPMFHAPHDYQIVAVVKLGSDAYRKDRAATKAPLYTFVPGKFVLADLKVGFRMTGAIVRGHFERGGAEIARQVKAEVVALIHARKLDPRAPASQGEHVVFGSRQEAYAVRIIAGKPDFDQIVAVDPPAGASDKDLAAGVLIKLPAPARPLVVGDRPNGLQVRGVVYLEVDELKQ